MGAQTSIEWAANADGTPGATWNPIRASYSFPAEFEDPQARPGEVITRVGTHCVHASEGCRNCYAETLNKRKLPGNGTGLPYTKQAESLVRIFLDERMLAAPLRRRKPTTWFLSSMTDVFADFVSDDMLDKLFAVMALSPHHTFIVLTKRAERMRAYLSDVDARGTKWCSAAWHIGGGDPGPAPAWPLPNVCLGVSAEDQATADARIPHLLATPARWRALSAEPLLGPMKVNRLNIRPPFGLRGWYDALAEWRDIVGERDQVVEGALDWVICGGESGPGARPMHPDWARSLRDQCAAAGVPFFFKQWGEWAPDKFLSNMKAEEEESTEFIRGKQCHEFDDAEVWRVGKPSAGRLLDGVEHNARPAFHEVDGRKGEARLLATTTSPGSPKA